MKKLPIGLQNFQEIIQKDYLYVDKTRQIYDLISQGKLYFLSRPRRFGKSLLISTLKQIFSGYQDLFKGLYIGEQTDYNWGKFPVLEFNFAKLGHKVINLEELLQQELLQQARHHDIELSTKGLSAQIVELVTQLSEEQPVVFLVDEYDKPIIDFLTDKAQSNTNRVVLRKFFSPLKDLEEKGHLHFVLITGVSKFNKVSIFSDLNNLTDLTIDPYGHQLLGITQQELLQYFKPYIQRSSQQLNMSETELLKNVKLWYDGYSYDGKTFLYNPFSLLNFFRKNRFGNFWFETGTPTFLVETIRGQKIKPTEIEGKKVTEIFFNKFTIEHLDIHGLLFQTGYLTINSTYRKGVELRYVLGYPNVEVRLSFIHNLLEAFSYQPSTIVGNALVKMEYALEKGDIATFIDQIQILLSDISYHLLPKNKKNPTPQDNLKSFEVWEGYFQTIIYLVTTFLGLHVQTEVTKHKGRLDLLAETDDYLYLMEFKLDESAKDAILQIKDRQYAASLKNSPKTILLVGISFSKKERNIETWEVEEWKRDQ